MSTAVSAGKLQQRAVALATLAGVCTLAVTVAARGSPTSPAANPPTFSKDVARILYQNCLSCHRSDEVAGALPLVTYEGARAAAASIKDQAASRQMPPWPADAKHSMAFRNDPRLSDRDIATLVAWVDAGAPKGNDADMPPTPVARTGWLHPDGVPPDAVLRLPDVSVAASGEIPYVLQRVKLPLTRDKWIVALQVRAGNNALIHHMGITEVSVADGMQSADLDALATVARQMGIADDALAEMRPAVADPLNPGSYDMLGVYTPGTTFEMYDHDSARLLKAGNNLYVNFNIHYTTTGRPETNHSELALWFASAPPKHQLFRAPAAVGTLIANGRQLLTDDPGTRAEGTEVAIPPIPAYAANYELIGMTAYTRPMTLYQLQPHAHVRGKDFTYSVVYPDGCEATVLSVPHYDFHWQLAYDLQTPLTLPAGSKLVVVSHYDNSPGNAHLREAGIDPQNCGPDKVAYFRRQNQSWHEMFSPLVQYSMDAAAPGGAGAPRLVQAVGCLSHADPRSWVLTRGSDPVATSTPSSSAAAARVAAATALGNRTYELIGARYFSLMPQFNRKVTVKGVLIEDAARTRLNVTSLQPAGSCL